MGIGYLKFEIHTGDDALPVANATITAYTPDGKVVFRTTTDENGKTETFRLAAPDKKNTLTPYGRHPPYAVYNADVQANGYVTKHIQGVEIVDTQTTIMPVDMQPLTDERARVTDEYIDIAPHHLETQVRNRQNEPPPFNDSGEDALPVVAESNTPSAFSIQNGVRIPSSITVHLGIPTNASARNVTVRFSDYIKNVVSGEIYSTWPLSSLEANINAIVTFALNRIYTEWYRSRGYNFDITSSTAYDMNFRDGGPVFENISNLVDTMFNNYARRIGFENPFFTQFCNGSTVTCPGLSQWGTVTLANQGRSPLEILRYYYPRDLELVISNNIGGIVASYPGYSLSVGSQGDAVRRMQDFLNRIRVNYPLIPQIANPNGVFGADTAEAVRMFQRTFNMTPDGIIGQATWNKINFIFVAVTKLAELNSEGIRATVGQNPPSSVISLGSRGEDVLQLQFLLNYISVFYPSVPTVIQDNVFDARDKNAVTEFQKTFGLTPDGVVGPATWNKLYAVYHGIQDNVPNLPEETPGTGGPPFPGTLLRLGSTGNDVKTMQAFLNVIRAVYPIIPMLTVDGVFGPATQEAVKIFQQHLFLTPDGIIGPITWDAIVQNYLKIIGEQGVSLTYPGTPLRIGSQGTDVRLMQTFLAELRAAYPSLPAVTVDGVFGPNTQASVMGFQRLFGLTVDGIIGPTTWNAIVDAKNKMG